MLLIELFRMEKTQCLDKPQKRNSMKKTIVFLLLILFLTHSKSLAQDFDIDLLYGQWKRVYQYDYFLSEVTGNKSQDDRFLVWEFKRKEGIQEYGKFKAITETYTTAWEYDYTVHGNDIFYTIMNLPKKKSIVKLTKSELVLLEEEVILKLDGKLEYSGSIYITFWTKI